MRVSEIVWRLVTCVLSMNLYVSGRRNKAVYCGACIGLVEEMNWGLATTDEREKLQVGSFRIDSHGKQSLSEVPLKYTELHLTDLLEEACAKVGQYAESRKTDSDKVNYIRTDSRDGQAISLRNVQISHDTQRILRFACDTVVEEHEDDIIAMFKNKEEKVHAKLCVDIAGMCSAENITDFMEALQDMAKDAVLEAEEAKVAEEARIKAEVEAKVAAEEEARKKAEEEEEWGPEGHDSFEDEIRNLEKETEAVEDEEESEDAKEEL